MKKPTVHDRRLKLEYRAITSLQAHPKNARTHPPDQLTRIANLIRRIGFVVPVLVDEHQTILKGHGSLMAGETVTIASSNESDDLWEVGRDGAKGLHPTQKPVELARRAIKNSTQEGEAVLDMFSGSASTLIAAEQTGRICYAIELDPQYVDVGIRRWQTLTGQQATHATEGRTFDQLTAKRTGKKKAA